MSENLWVGLTCDQEFTPLIYTPTVGEACQRWSELYTQPEGEHAFTTATAIDCLTCILRPLPLLRGPRPPALRDPKLAS